MTLAEPSLRPDRLDTLIACPHCDCLHTLASVPVGATARCSRCHSVLLSPRRGAIATIVSLAFGALILMISAVSFPFLEIEASGISSAASVIDAVTAFAEASGMMAPLSAIVGALIILLPVGRLVGIIYALGPLAMGRQPAAHAGLAFRVAMRLRPWAMAEIFILGVAVALVKIVGLASVEFGSAFWAFVGLVLLIAAKDTMICERSIWRILARK
ncbi:paraquat-inducible protein A [Fluviibacterium sp. DFM31]|uniref:Paraquat-inducible protein A n=1 Tax=Meridianimarinicoccus marinus TaxID=3231483 RepID=A0ABV3L920_9RHOB